MADGDLARKSGRKCDSELELRWRQNQYRQRRPQLESDVCLAEPFFSPDGQWVGFFAQGKLKKTRIDDGDPISLCDAPSGRGGTWGEDGNIIAALNSDVGLTQVPSGEATWFLSPNWRRARLATGGRTFYPVASSFCLR